MKDDETDAALGSTGAVRLAIGLAQGLALYLLYLAAEDTVWPATNGIVFAPLTLIAWFVPLILLVSVRSLRFRTLAIWTVAALAVLAGLAVHDLVRDTELNTGSFWFGYPPSQGNRIAPSPFLFGFGAIGLFIAQALIGAGDADRRYIASYPRYFDVAWKQAVQLVFAAAFVGAFWALLWLGAGLFELVKIDFLTKLIGHRWFAIPATTLALASAIHVTDVRAGIVRGIRTLKLTLLSWLLPLLTLIAVGFLGVLPFTGLERLWSTRHATALLLTVATLLVLLVNAAYQDGQPERAVPRVFRWAGSLASLALVPLTALAGYAVALRIGQHGWTTDRIIAVAYIGIVAVHALGYAIAVVWPGAWLKRLEGCNVLGAFVTLAILLALFTPVADPARISVASQVARLEAGTIPPDKFDFAFLRFDGGRYGREALARLKSAAEGPNAAAIRVAADKALRMPNRFGGPVTPPTSQDLAANITVFPAGRSLPEAFLRQNFNASAPQQWFIPQCLKDRSQRCEAYLVPLGMDGAESIIIGPADNRGSQTVVFVPDADSTWKPAGILPTLVNCGKIRDALRSG
ncbi:MAG TPA: DUF4153 domain-containing protein, partial [Candidatus Cybelea sp.]|nr:DUF4153 domain-containing protein [Candidatus Cybelea sp.]